MYLIPCVFLALIGPGAASLPLNLWILILYGDIMRYIYLNKYTRIALKRQRHEMSFCEWTTNAAALCILHASSDLAHVCQIKNKQVQQQQQWRELCAGGALHLKDTSAKATIGKAAIEMRRHVADVWDVTWWIMWILRIKPN